MAAGNDCSSVAPLMPRTQDLLEGVWGYDCLLRLLEYINLANTKSVTTQKLNQGKENRQLKLPTSQ
jgi:hypothetical protein